MDCFRVIAILLSVFYKQESEEYMTSETRLPRRLIIHDWNGCLIDDAEHRYLYGVCAIFEEYGIQAPTREQYKGEITSDWIKFYYKHGIPRSEYGVEHDKQALDTIMNDHLSRAPIPPLFPETRGFLDTLAMQQHCKQVLVSALNTHEFHRQYHFHRLSHYFTETHAEILDKAPLFDEIRRRLNALPEETIGVTDTMSDVKALTAAGIDSIIVPRGHCKPNAAMFPTMRIAEDLNEALAIILGTH